MQATQLPPKAKLALLSIELVRPEVKTSIEKAAKSLRASTEWMVQAKYGIMTHWTARSKPRYGPPKTYAKAVEDFDVESFAAMVQRTGAGFVVITTSWADYYFPAPIKVIDKILLADGTNGFPAQMAVYLLKAGACTIIVFHPAGSVVIRIKL